MNVGKANKKVVWDYVFALPNGSKLTILSTSGAKAERLFRKFKKEHGY